MVHLIDNAHRFVYIENQYFCAGFCENEDLDVATGDDFDAEESIDGSELIKNSVGLAVERRITAAIKAGEPFKVVVVLPHLAWEGNSIQSAILGFQQATIRRLFGNLRRSFPDVVDWAEYLSFYNLRTYGITEKGAVMEEIYVHDKLMIVDDRIVLIGSANINDRSLLGHRDSEIGAVIHDVQTVDSKMDGKLWQAGKFARKLRVRLWRECMGLGELDEVLFDPIRGWKEFDRRAKKNRAVYERCWPETMYSDAIKSISPELSLGGNKFVVEESVLNDLREGVDGIVVSGAVGFLKEEDLRPEFGTKAYMLPSSFFI